MSLLAWLLTAFITGMVVGPLFVMLIAPYIDSAAKFIARVGIRAGGDWVLKPVGATEYDLIPVEYDSAEGRAWLAGDEDSPDREYYDDDGGRMRTLFGKSFGLAVEDVSAIVDPVDCQLGKKEAEKVADGGQLSQDETAIIEDLRSRAHIGTLEKTYDGGVKQRIDYINPFVSINEDDTGTIVDVRDAVTLLSKNGSPETPRKTAENAAQAERAFEQWGEFKRNVSLIAAFMMGAIVTEFIAGGGGGGGGGGISVGLSLARPMMDMGAVLLGVA
jgi:hypothetical protein